METSRRSEEAGTDGVSGGGTVTAPGPVAAVGGEPPPLARADELGERSALARFRRRRPDAADRAALAGVVLLLAFLWGRGRDIWYWLDEGLSVGISSHHLGSIAGLLREDGSPPLYYWLLHFWMAAFGTTEERTHLLSLAFALAAVVAAWWLGRSLFGRRTAWMLVALYAMSPFLAVYANETRMYSLLTLLATLATGAFLHVYVHGRRRYLPLFAVSLALMLYTHNWALLFTLGLGAALVPCWFAATDRRRLFVDAVIGFGGAGLLFAPWLPTLSYQMAHTGAPWAEIPTLAMVRDDLTQLLGGPEAVVALILGAGATLLVLLRRPFSRAATGIVAAATAAVVTMAIGWAMSQSSSIWTYRYLGVVLPALLIVGALGLAGGGRAALAALGVIAFFAAPIDVRKPHTDKSNLRGVIAQTAPVMQRGDLVISADFGEIPLLHHYLPGMRYASSEGLVPDADVSDQRDTVTRLRNSRYRQALPPLVDQVPVGHHVLVVCPPISAAQPYETPFIRLTIDRCDDINHLVAGDPRLKLVSSVDATTTDIKNTPVNALLFVKQAP